MKGAIIPINTEEKETKRDFNKLWKTFRKYYDIESPSDIIQLNLLCSDLLRLKAAHKRMLKHGQFRISESGNDDVSPVGFYINQLEGQIRSTLRELKITRRTADKTKDEDFSSIIANAINVEESKGTESGKSKS